MTQTMDGKTTKSQSRFWISGDKYRMESQDPKTGETMILIDDGQEQYVINPKEKTAMKMEGMVKNMYAGSLNSDLYAQAAEQRKAAKKVGTGKVAGKPCTVFAYQSKIGGVTGDVKEWVWNGKGFPLKTVTSNPAQTVTMMGHQSKIPASTYENVVTEIALDKAVPASLFKLPPDVKVRSMGMGRGHGGAKAGKPGAKENEGPPEEIPAEVQDMMKNLF